MSQEVVNMKVPEDCLKMLKAGLEKSNKAGSLSLEEAFYMHLALKNLSEHVTKCKEHVCVPPLVEVPWIDELPQKLENSELKTN